MDNTQNINM